MVCFFCSFCFKNYQICREREKEEVSKGDSVEGEEELKRCIPCKVEEEDV